MPTEKETPSSPAEVRVSPFTINLTVYYALQRPSSPDSALPAVLLALHGWGQNCKRFLRDFRPLEAHNILVVAPQAPHQFYLDMATKKVGFSWLTIYERTQAILDVNQYLRRLLDHIAQDTPYDPARVFLLGFSQGSSMAYRFAVSGLLQPAGLISCCSDLPPDVAEVLHAHAPFPVLLAHGEEDGLIPREKLSEAGNTLRQAGFPCEEHLFPGGHEITPGLVATIGDWMNQQSARATP
ncbi:MAG: dienelactone hydrolase family protein [Candidatus Hydrogenedentes bacterium]|nr:dienelactone hydrolase family protein [Candidatus Hydrogenedentota bacterium]